jgi:hypothetical protein
VSDPLGLPDRAGLSIAPASTTRSGRTSGSEEDEMGDFDRDRLRPGGAYGGNGRARPERGHDRERRSEVKHGGRDDLADHTAPAAIWKMRRPGPRRCVERVHRTTRVKFL